MFGFFRRMRIRQAAHRECMRIFSEATDLYQHIKDKSHAATMLFLQGDGDAHALAADQLYLMIDRHDVMTERHILCEQIHDNPRMVDSVTEMHALLAEVKAEDTDGNV